MQYRIWKEISKENGFRDDFHLLNPTMKGEIRGHSIVIQNAAYLGGRSSWSHLQIWIKLNSEIPVNFIIYQKGNDSYRPPALNHLEKLNLSLDYLGERFVLESKLTLQNSLPLQDPHLIRLFTTFRCIGMAVDGGKFYYERNDISYSAAELKQLMEELLSLADVLEREA